MKGISASAPVAVALYASSVFASALSAALHPLSPRQTSLPEVTVKGNGMHDDLSLTGPEED